MDWLALSPLAFIGWALWARARGEQRNFRIAGGMTIALFVLTLALGARDLVVQKIFSYLAMPAGLLFVGLGALTILLFAKKEKRVPTG